MEVAHAFNNKSNLRLDGCTVESSIDFTFPNCSTLYQYWIERCDLTPDIGPQHENFELTDIISCAPYTIYKDVINSGYDFKNRYWGTEVSRAFGVESTGKLLRDYYSGAALEQVLEVASFIISDIHAVKIHGKPKFVTEDNFNQFEAIYVPLFDSKGTPSRFIGVYDFFN
jgi:hypothetical protein